MRTGPRTRPPHIARGAAGARASSADALPAGLVVPEAPAGARDVVALKKGAKDGDEVVVRGRVGGSLVATGGLTMMRSTNESPAADAIGLSKGRSDITASAAYFLSPTIALFAGTGRTIGNTDGTGTNFMLTGGVSFSYAPRLVQ